MSKKYEKSIQYFKKSIKVNNDLDNKLGVAQVTQMLGVSYSSIKQLDSALVCFDKAKTVYKKLNAEEQLQDVNDNLVGIYRKQKKYETALYLSLKILTILKQKVNNWYCAETIMILL